MHFRFKPRRNPGSQSQHRSVNRTAVALSMNSPSYAQQSPNCAFNSFERFQQFRADTAEDQTSPSQDSGDKRWAGHIAQRNALIKELTEYLESVDWRKDPSTHYGIAAAIGTLGEIRAAKATPVLANFLDFRGPGIIFSDLDPGKIFPAIPALLNIGTPSFSAAFGRLTQMSQPSNIAARNGLWVLALLENHSKFDIKALRVRLEKEKQSTRYKSCRKALQRIILQIEALNELKGHRRSSERSLD